MPAGTYGVAFELRDYGTATTTALVTAGAVTTVPTVGLVRDTGGLMGTATLQGSGNSSGIQVTVTPLPTAGNPSPAVAGAAITDASGAWRIDALAVGSYRLAYAPPAGYLAPPTVTVVVVANALVTADPVVATINPGTLRGTALLEGAAAGGHAGTQVQVEGTNLSTFTLADGSWIVTGVGTGAQTVVFSAAGFDTQRIQVVTQPGGDLTLVSITLAASRGDVTGVVDAAGTTHDEGTVVTVSGGPDTATTVTDAAGRWRARGLRVASGYTATFLRGGYASTTTSSFSISAGGLADLGTTVLPVATTATVAGVAHLVRPAGADAGTAVSLTGTDLNANPVTRATLTVAGGAWSIGALPQGTYQVTLSRTGYDSQTLSGLAAVAGATATAPTVTLQVAAGAIAGGVTLDVSTVPGFPAIADRSGTVVAVLDGATQVAATLTDAGGNYLFPSVPALPVSGANYTVTAQRQDFTTSSIPVTPSPGSTVGGQNLSIQLRTGTITGAVVLWDNVANLGANGSNAGATVSLSGTAFTGAPWVPAALVTDLTGAWTFASLPPGSYGVTVTSAGRACAASAPLVAQPGGTTVAAGVQCTDRVAPGVVGLGASQKTGSGLPGYVSGTSATIPVLTQAADDTLPTSNLSGYELVVGAAPDWNAASFTSAPAAFVVASGLPADATSTVWVRAVDWAENAGPAVSVQVVQDGSAPGTPVISTPGSWVSDLSTSVTLTGSDADPNFLRYEACWATLPATGICAASPGVLCAPTMVAQTFPLPLAADQKTCIWAQAVDKAGNVSGLASGWVVSDLTLPTPPTFAPSFDPTQITFHAEYVDFFLAQAATDGPAGGGVDWRNVAYLEVNSGAGLTPLCPAADCHRNGVYSPCAVACACTDPRLLCSGTSFLGVRMPLLGGVLNEFQARAVDLAGNAGSVVSQQVDTSGSVAPVLVTTGQDWAPRVLDGLLAVANRLYELGPDQRLDPADTWCTVPLVANYNSARPMMEPASGSLVVYGASLSPSSTVTMRRAGASGLCAAGYTEAVIRTTGAYYLAAVTASGERAAWSEGAGLYTALTAYVQEPGTDGKLGGTSSPAPTSMGTYASLTDIQLRGGSLLVYGDPGTGKRWTVWTAPTGAITPASASYTFPASVAAAGLSSDGKLLATFSTTGQLAIRQPNGSGVYDGVTVPVTHTFSTSVGSPSVAIQGSHAVAFNGSVPSYVHHWYAGGDGVFGTLDDVYATILPQSAVRYQPTLGTGLGEGMLYYQVGQTNTGVEVDAFSLDLAAFRWDSPPVSSASNPLMTNRAGVQFFNPSSGGLVNRTSDGRQAATTGLAFPGGAEGADVLLSAPGGVIQHVGPDASGQWFTATAQPPVTLYSGATGSQVAVGNGKALVRGPSNTVQVLQPVGGSFRNGATAVRIDTHPNSVPNAYGTAITGPHAFYTCTENGSGALRLCYHYAGSDGVYGTGPEGVTAPIGHLGGALYYGVQSVKAHAGKVFVSNAYGGATYVLEPGPDGVFGTADDVVHAMGLISPLDRAFDLGGRYFAWVEAVTGIGPQVFVKDLVSGAQRQVTSHYSDKVFVNVDVTGRLSWIDSAFATPMVFVSSP